MTTDHGSTADLLGTLGEIEEAARRAQQALSTGRASTGAAALARIEDTAKDAKRRGIARREGLDFVRDPLPAS